MSISGLGNTTYNQMFQAPPEKSGGQIIQQQTTVAQGPAEENKEVAPYQGQESEGTESKSINIFA